MAYHHFPDIYSITKTLTRFLEPGGMLIVTDIAQPEEKGVLFKEEFRHIVAHHEGISEDDMEAAFLGAGLEGFHMENLDNLKARMHGKDVVFFLACGTKPSA